MKEERLDEPLKNYIWYGRNQSLHSEEGKIKNKDGRLFFDKIVEANSDKFKNVDSPNFAEEVVEILGWYDYESYENDMLLLNTNRVQS